MENINKLNQKKGVLLQDVIGGMILFSAIIALMFVMASAFGANYNSAPISNSFQAKYNSLTTLNTTVNGMFKAASTGDGLSLVGSLPVMFQASFQVFFLIFGSIGIVTGWFNNMIVDLLIPSSVAAIAIIVVMGIFTVVVVFKVLNAITRGQF